MKKILFFIVILFVFAIFITSEAMAGEIHDAVNNRNPEEVKEIIKNNPGSLHATDEKGRTPLHLAIIKGDDELAEYLVRAGADVNAVDGEGKNPRYYASKYSRRKIESILIEKNAARSGKPVPGYAAIQGIESQIPGIHITGHPPNPPEKVFRFAYITAFILLIFAALLQYFLNKRFLAPVTDTFDENETKKASGQSLKKALIIVFVTVLYFVLLEAVLQVYVYYHPYRVFIPDPQSHWKINPAITRSKENKAEKSSRCDYIIDQAYRYKKDEGTIRILCLGDSQTLGLPWVKGIRFTYPRQLQKKLREELKTDKIEVMNMGVSGYSSFQGLIFLKNICLSYNPDFIIVAYGYHDGNGSFAPDRDITSENPRVKAFRSILYRSQIYLMIRRKILERRAFRKVEDGMPVYRRVSLEDYHDNLKKFVEMGNKKNAKVIFFTVPHLGREGTGRMPYTLEMRKTAKELNVPLIDGVEEMSRIPVEEQKKYFFNDGAHFTKTGNEFIGEILCRGLKPLIDKK